MRTWHHQIQVWILMLAMVPEVVLASVFQISPGIDNELAEPANASGHQSQSECAAPQPTMPVDVVVSMGWVMSRKGLLFRDPILRQESASAISWLEQSRLLYSVNTDLSEPMNVSISSSPIQRERLPAPLGSITTPWLIIPIST